MKSEKEYGWEKGSQTERSAYLDLAEPLFQYICKLSRSGKKKAHIDCGMVRGEIEGLLQKIARECQKDVTLARLHSKLEMVLVYYVDSVISHSLRLPIADEWSANRLADSRGYEAGDEHFFVLLDAAIKDTSEDSSEVLSVFYLCLCLGFEGMFIGQTDKIDDYIKRVFPRVRHLIDSNITGRICQEAYHADTTDLSEGLKSSRIGMIGIAFAFLSLSMFIIYYSLYVSATDSLRESMRVIQAQPQGSGK